MVQIPGIVNPNDPYYGFGFGMGNTGAGGPMNTTMPMPGSGVGGVTVPPIGSGGSGFGFNMPTAQLALTGLGTVGNLWAAFQAQNLAKQQFNYTRDVTNTNLNNQIKSYNTSLEDRARSRGFVEGSTADAISSYIDKNRLSR